MRRLESMILLAGLGLALYVGAGVLLPSTTEPEPAAVMRQPVETTVVSEPEYVEVVEMPPPPPPVEELPAAISEVLAANGHTEFVDRSVLEAEIPASVVAVLIEHDVVLRVAESEGALP